MNLSDASEPYDVKVLCSTPEAGLHSGMSDTTDLGLTYCLGLYEVVGVAHEARLLDHLLRFANSHCKDVPMLLCADCRSYFYNAELKR